MAVDCVQRLWCGSSLLSVVVGTRTTYLADVHGFLGHPENTVVTQYLKIGPYRLYSSISEVPSYIWS